MPKKAIAKLARVRATANRPLRAVQRIERWEDGSSVTHYRNGAVRVRGASDDTPRRNTVFPTRAQFDKYSRKRKRAVNTIMRAAKAVRRSP